MADTSADAPLPLSRYNAKRDFQVTSEPAGTLPKGKKTSKVLVFVVQKHWASRLQYDLRIELDGVMLSWAVPKGPSFDPAEKRMAVHVEDHTLSYNNFEGTIPAKQYGAGTFPATCSESLWILGDRPGTTGRHGTAWIAASSPLLRWSLWGSQRLRPATPPLSEARSEQPIDQDEKGR